MNKSDLIKHIAEDADISKAAAERALDAFIENVSSAVTNGDSVALAGFGTFKRAARSQRKGRNPATGEAVTIPAKRLPKFVPAGAFKSRVNG